jgi:glycosyltransferase involved in cell wall biosynthesis
MKILVITPTLGRSPFLKRTVASVDTLRESGFLIKHIIVVPPPFLRELAIIYPQCLVVGEDGCGMYSAINQGINESGYDFDFWTYLNDDDFLFDDFEKVLNKADKLSPTAFSVIYGRVSIVDSRDIIQNKVSRWTIPSLIKGALAGKRSPLNQQGVLWSSSILSLVGDFDESLKYASDYDYFMRCALRGASFYYIDASVAAYRVHPNQLGQNGAAFIEELELVRSRYHIWTCYRILCECLFVVLNIDIYIWRLIRRKPFGIALFSRFS